MSTIRSFLFILALLPALCWGNPININTADAKTLSSLSGVGPAKAAAIIEHRNTVGEFTSVDRITEVKGIGPKLLEKLRKQITINSK